MKLKNFNCIIGFLIIFTHSPLLCEEKIDIWKNKKEEVSENIKKKKLKFKKKQILRLHKL